MNPAPASRAAGPRRPGLLRRRHANGRGGRSRGQFSPNTLSNLAAALGTDGIATLRFDKYGTGRTGLGAFAGHPEDLDHPAFVRQAAAGQLTPDQKQAASPAVDRAVADFRARRPVDATSLLPPIAALFQSLEGTNRRFVESADRVEPAQVARRLPAATPVLLTCGTADPQVPCDMTDALTAALRHAGGPGRVVLPDVGHNLDTTARPGALAPSALAALRRLPRCGTAT